MSLSNILKSHRKSEIIFEETPIGYKYRNCSIFYVNGISFMFKGNINDFAEHFENVKIKETEGAGIWWIKVL